MNLPQKFLLFCILLKTSFSFGQDSTWKVVPFWGTEQGVGYVYQATHNFEFTLSTVGIYKNHNYLVLRIGVDIFKNNVWYVAPLAALTYRQMLGKKWGVEGSIYFWRKKILGAKSTFLTPELGISRGWLHLCYGYNISLSENPSPIFNQHRISVRLGI